MSDLTDTPEQATFRAIVRAELTTMKAEIRAELHAEIAGQIEALTAQTDRVLAAVAVSATGQTAGARQAAAAASSASGVSKCSTFHAYVGWRLTGEDGWNQQGSTTTLAKVRRFLDDPDEVAAKIDPEVRAAALAAVQGLFGDDGETPQLAHKVAKDHLHKIMCATGVKGLTDYKTAINKARNEQNAKWEREAAAPTVVDEAAAE